MPSLSDTERASLLQLARLAVTEAVCHGRLPDHIPGDGTYSKRCGLFVTLHVGGRLRGCIGVVDPHETLAESVVRCATGAALRDPRFPPLTSKDVCALQVEISLLSTPFVIQPNEIEVGRHGLIVTRGSHRGLLLPQVGVEHGFNAEQFLSETCRKAQLPLDAWRDSGTRVSAFTCEVFSSPAPCAGMETSQSEKAR